MIRFACFITRGFFLISIKFNLYIYNNFKNDEIVLIKPFIKIILICSNEYQNFN